MTDFPQQEMPFVPYQTARTLRGREKNKQTKRHEADMKQEQKHVFSMLLYRRINTKSFKIIYSPKKKKKKKCGNKNTYFKVLCFLTPFYYLLNSFLCGHYHNMYALSSTLSSALRQHSLWDQVNCFHTTLLPLLEHASPH